MKCIADLGGSSVKISVLDAQQNAITIEPTPQNNNNSTDDTNITNKTPQEKNRMFFQFPNFKAKSKKLVLFGPPGLEEPANKYSFHFPFEKGFCVDWNVQKEILEFFFRNHNLNLTEKTFAETLDVIMTHNLEVPQVLQREQYEVFFEDYQISRLFSATPSFFSLINYCQRNPSSPLATNGSAIMLDVGYSGTTIIPFFDFNRINYACQRINIGGKILTNYLKELISYRFWDMMDDSYLVNIIKEKACYLSLDFSRELQKAKDTKIMTLNYLLPNYISSVTGRVLEPGEEKTLGDEEQILHLNNERICVPEILFHPSDCGIMQAGIPESIGNVVEKLNICRDLVSRKVLFFGGSSLFPNFHARLKNDLKQWAPEELLLETETFVNPMAAPWEGACDFAYRQNFTQFAVSKAEYEENGARVCNVKFLN